MLLLLKISREREGLFSIWDYMTLIRVFSGLDLVVSFFDLLVLAGIGDNEAL